MKKKQKKNPTQTVELNQTNKKGNYY